MLFITCMFGTSRDCPYRDDEPPFSFPREIQTSNSGVFVRLMSATGCVMSILYSKSAPNNSKLKIFVSEPS